MYNHIFTTFLIDIDLAFFTRVMCYMDMNLGSDFFDRYFQEKRSIGDRDGISSKLLDLAEKE